MSHRALAIGIAAALAAGPPSPAASAGQARGQRGQQPPQSPRAIAPSDFTGYWVSVVTEDWRWRMVTPAKGDYDSVPLNASGRREADTWDPQRDEAAGEACRACQERPNSANDHPAGLGSAARKADLAAWPADHNARSSARRSELARRRRKTTKKTQRRRAGMFGGPPPKPGGALKVVTSRIRPGYLRKNGVPFSANAVLTEYFNVLGPEDNGDLWLVVTTIVQDPQYLNTRFFTSTHFKKLPDGSSWHPTACRAS